MAFKSSTAFHHTDFHEARNCLTAHMETVRTKFYLQRSRDMSIIGKSHARSKIIHNNLRVDFHETRPTVFLKNFHTEFQNKFDKQLIC